MKITKEELKILFEKGRWYHTFEYDGLKSNGTYDYRKLIQKMGLPSVKGMTVLDVGCADGYFSYYFKKYGDAISVLGIDSNKYDGNSAIEHMVKQDSIYKEKYSKGNDFNNFESIYKKLSLNDSNKFNLIKEIYSQDIEFMNASIYDLSKLPKFDFVFCGSLIEHLRDPITAVEQLYSKTGKCCVIDLSSTLSNYLNPLRLYLVGYTGSGGSFYNFSETAFKKLLTEVGFTSIKIASRYEIKNNRTHKNTPHTVFICET